MTIAGLTVLSALGLAAFLEIQCWQDSAFRGGWRLQAQLLTGRCRVVAPDGAVTERGFGAGCREAFDAAAVSAPAQESEELVLLLHGLGRTPDMFDDLRPALEGRGRTVVALRYASMAADVRGHGDWLNGLLDRHPRIRKVSFVTHSLGGLVLRAALDREPAWRRNLALGRVVMLAPPNQGALLARKLDRWTPAALVLGPSFTEMAGRGDLPAPLAEEVPLAIIAGGCCTGRGYNPLLPSDDDGVVQVSETRMVGADTEMLVETLHTFIANDDEAIAAIRDFLDDPHPSPATAGESH